MNKFSGLPSHEHVILSLPNGWSISLVQGWFPNGDRAYYHHKNNDEVTTCEVAVFDAHRRFWNDSAPGPGQPFGWVGATELAAIIARATQAALASGVPSGTSGVTDSDDQP